jgi:hypothetical protein
MVANPRLPFSRDSRAARDRASGLTPAVSFVRGGFLEENEVLDVDRLDT